MQFPLFSIVWRIFKGRFEAFQFLPFSSFLAKDFSKMPGPICLKFCTDHLWTIVEGTVSQNFYFLSESWDIGHQKWRLETFFTNWLWLVINSIIFPWSKIWDTVPCIFAIRICGQNLTSLAFQVFEKSWFKIKISFFVKKWCHVTK